MLKYVMGGMALWLAVSALACNAQTLPVVSPASGSDPILASRPPATANALVFTYTRTVTAQGKPVTSETGTVTLGADFTAIEQGTDHVLDDFALCRVLSWKTGESALDNQSCFFMPAFRLSELHNRQAMNRILAAAMDKKTAPASFAPYWAEQELSIQDDASDPLKPQTGPAETDYSLNGHIVVRISATGAAFTADEHREVARYLARRTDLHPQILRAILASGQLPDTVVIERYEADQPQTETLHFSDVSRPMRAYPLPPHLTAAMAADARGDSPQARGLRQVLAALDGTAQPPRPDFDTLMKQLDAAINAKQAMASTMVFQELVSQYGGSLMSDTARMGRLKAILPGLQTMFAEPESASFMAASKLAGDGKPTPQNEAAARYLSRAKDMDGLPFGTYRYVTFANLVRASGDTSTWDKTIFTAMPSLSDCYWTHIAAYPWASNIYKDLGDLEYEDYAMDKAWQAWDLARAVDPDWRTGILQSVVKYEDRLRTALPDIFRRA